MNINLNEEQKKNIENKFLEFQRIWTLEKVKSMSLEDYVKIGSKDTFTYWIEYFLKDVGSIRGGSISKYGIYKRNFSDDKENLKGKIYNDNYVWLSKYGNNQDEAFNKIKQIIIDIIQASKNNDLETIENIDFGDATKWKIAFHYQNIENIKIVNIFSKNVLDLISLNKFKEKLKIYQVYKKLLENKNLSLIEMIENLSIPLWNKYGINSQNFDNFEDNIENPPLNQILYGPPGTGKTYHAIDKALEILGENLKNRDDKKAKFDEYVKNGQIVFTTFHQSYGYEEFVEGIKPRIYNEENSKEIEYEIKDGIFKELCQKALENYKASLLTQEEFVKSEDLENKIEIFLDELVDQQKFIEKTQSGGFRLEEYNEKYRIITDDTNANLYLNLEIFKTLLENKDKIINGRSIKQILNHKHRRQIDSYYFQLVKLFKEREQNYKVDNSSKKPDLKPYIIIIDEINRGNVSKIFGELITLIEPSKRIGEKEEIKVKLPYSGKEFGVPKNVYIIGTMNTADRSITSLDTALRRRFEFIEMMPDVEELEKSKYKDVNLKKLLEAINTRIEYLLDREKTIGHAFFIGIDNLEKLKNVFQNKIIPLLQEYFYNDYALINMVLNDNGMIFEDKKDDKYLQKIKNLDSVNSERSIYNIAPFNDEIWNKIEIYQAIYDDKIANRLKNENE
ncbi:AAA family ATPase [Campylobacter peloridis]|uniref:AAA family ATPase n=1 Tax=Campylobacter peloridis TaxID=488546 RepID=A0A5C7DYA6_9BACT|nr:AAA family ATPase [Campylobacter peloridis]TXE84466.1 AAA family ATPase [Campylobacter peloridis]